MQKIAGFCCMLLYVCCSIERARVCSGAHLEGAVAVTPAKAIAFIREFERTKGLTRSHLQELSKVMIDALARERVAPDLKVAPYPCIECGERVAMQYVLSIAQMCNRCASLISGKVGGIVSSIVRLVPTERQLKAAAAGVSAPTLQLKAGEPIEGEYLEK